MSFQRKFGKVNKLTKGGAVIPIKPELLGKINREFNIDTCLDIFNDLPRIREELTALREPKCYAGVFIKDDLPYRIVKYDDLFGSPTFVVYNFNGENYTKPVKCLSYSLYRNEVFGYSITMLLNLLQTCNILRETGRDLLVRLYISHNLFLLKPEEYEKPEIESKLIYVLTILDELLKFPFFELHQVYIEEFHSRSLIPEVIEKQRLFRFISFIDPTLDVSYSKDIDSIITNTELEDFERFYRDESYLLGYYNFYKRLSNYSGEIKTYPKSEFLNVNNYEDENFEILGEFESRPIWFSLYQNAFPKPMLKYKLPAGLVMVKRGVITVERFREIFNLIKTNYHKIKVFLFNLIGSLTNHKGETLKRNRYSYDFDNLVINYDFYKIDRKVHPPLFPEPTVEDQKKFNILQSIHYCGGLYQSYYISPLETLNIGFDENFLTNLLSFIPEGRVLELEVDEKMTTTTKHNVPIINDFKTTFELKPDSIEYLPVDTTPFSLGGKKKLKKTIKKKNL
jgi:hypothetical protein